MKKNGTILFCGFAVILATVVLYLLAFDNILSSTIHWLSLSILLFVEVLGTCKALCKSSIFNVARVVIGAVHLLATAVLSIIFISLYPRLILLYILLNVLILIAVTVVDVLLIHFKSSSTAKNPTTDLIAWCEKKAKRLCLENKNAALSSQLQSLVELFTYANRTMSCPEDQKLFAKLNELEASLANNDVGKANETLTQLHNIMNFRKETAKKTGSF